MIDVKLERNQFGHASIWVGVLVKPMGTNQVVATSEDNAIRALWAQNQTYPVPFEDVAQSQTNWMRGDFEKAGYRLNVTQMPIFGAE